MGSADRSALIVASDSYEDPGLRELRAPAHDAAALARVLADERVGGFEVRKLLNAPAHEISLAVETFFAERSRDDLLLLHLSCHGVKSQSGELHFATTNTRLELLASTSVPAAFVNQLMTQSRSRRIVLLLDCCYAGAFARGMTARAGPNVGVSDHFEGSGRAIITASSAMEYAFEGDALTDTAAPTPSLFTTALVRGLETGDADQDLDGWVGLDELYDYVYTRVRDETPDQTPTKWTLDLQGELHIARRAQPPVDPSPLPRELQQAVDSPLAGVRAGAIEELARVLRGGHVGLALAARLALERLGDDDSRTVAARAAAAALAAGPAPERRREPVPTPGPAENPELVGWYDRALAVLGSSGSTPSSEGLEKAVSLLERVVGRQADFRDATARLEASRRRLAAALYRNAADLVAAADWHAAEGVLSRIDALDPEHGDPDGLYGRVLVEAKLDQARRHAEQQVWEPVLRLLDEAREIDPADHRIDDLRVRAEAAIESRRLVGDARTAYAAGRWRDAVAAFEQAARLDDHVPTDDPEWAAARRQLAAQRRQRVRRAVGGTLAAGGAAALVVLLVIQLLSEDQDSPGDDAQPEAEPDDDGPVEQETDLVAARLDQPPEIDGDDADWPDGPVHRTEHVAVEPELDLDADPQVESEWRLGWDEDALYLFAEVTDPEVRTPNASQPWDLNHGDAVEFHFGRDPTDLSDGDGLRDDDVLIMLGPVDPGTSGHAASGLRRPGDAPEDHEAVGCDGVFVRIEDHEATAGIDAFAAITDGGYRIEAAVPWSLLGPTAEPGGIYAMNLTVTDVEPEGDRRHGSRSTNPDREGNKHCPGAWGTLTLQDDGS